jgi:hypothetical protein
LAATLLSALTGLRILLLLLAGLLLSALLLAALLLLATLLVLLVGILVHLVFSGCKRSPPEPLSTFVCHQSFHR